MFHDPQQRAVAIGVWMSCFMGGMAIGPVIGGVLLDNFWWGSAFLLGVPVMVLLLVVAPVLLPEYRDPDPGRLDLASVALSLAAILPVVYGLKELAKHGWETVPVGALLLGAAVGTVFVRRQRVLTHPLLDVRLFGNPAFSVSLGLFLLNGAIMGGSFLLVSQYLQLVTGLSPLAAGLWLVPQALAMIGATMVAPLLARRIRPAYVMTAGQLICAVGFVLLARLDSADTVLVVVAAFVIAAVGIALPSALVTDLIVGSVPPEKAGSAASTSETSGELGIALGVATLGSLAAAVYRGRLDGTLPPGLTADAVASTQDGLAGAATVAADLPGGSAAALLDSARDAFTAGLNTAAAIGVVVLLVLAAVAARWLRHVPPYAAHPEAASQPGNDAASGPDLTSADAGRDAPVTTPAGCGRS